MMIEQFLNYLRYERNRSPLTAQSYGEDLRAFETYFKNLDNHLSWESVDADVIRSWMESMMDKGNTATSIGRRLSALRSFFRFALTRGMIATDPSRAIRSPKQAKPLPQFVKETEMDVLLDDDGLWGDGFKDVRDRTMLLVFYETGMRLSELKSLDRGSVDFDNRQVRVHGKGDKDRLVPFGPEMEQALLYYIKVRDEHLGCSPASLFVTVKGRRMNSDQVRYVVRKHLARVSVLRKRSPHVLRHTFATAMLNNGAGLESVKKLLGHQNLNTTEVYTHSTFEQLKRVYKQAHPRA